MNTTDEQGPDRSVGPPKGGPGATPARPLRANRDYRLWWFGNLLSLAGTQMSLIAMPLIVLTVTGSPLLAGLVSSVEAVPFIFFSLPAGIAVDRIDRKALLMWSSAVSVVAIASIPIAYAGGSVATVHLFVVAFVNGAAGVVQAIAQSASLPAVVTAEELGPASAQAETSERLAAIVGPPVAALLFESFWPGLPFVVDAVSFALIIVVIASLRTSLGPHGSAADAASEGGWGRDDFFLGAREVVRNRLLRDLTGLTIVGDFLFAGIGLLMIVLVREAGSSGLGTGGVFSIAAAGGVVGSLVAARVEDRIGLTQAVVGKHVLTAAIFPLLALDLPPMLVGLVWGTISFQVSILNVIQRRYQLETIASDVLGRVQGFVTFLSFGSLPFGTALTGYLLEGGGPRFTVFAYTTVLGVLALWSLASRSVRTATTTLRAVRAQEVAAGGAP